MLSSRAQAAIKSPANPLWRILKDQYCAKTNPQGYVNLGVAENTLMHDELVAQLKRHFNPPQSALSYGCGPGGSLRLKLALAGLFNRFFAPHRLVSSSHINISNGVTAALERCAFELGDPGDIFLLGRPYYGSYPSDVGDRAGIKTLAVSFGNIDPISLAAVSCYENALLSAKNDSSASGTIKALILCSPHNPLGQCYPRSVLEAILRLCQKHQIHLICDEIYALSVFNNPAVRADRFTSVLSINKAKIIDPGLVHVLWGMSKDFGANGMRIGCVVSQDNPEFISALDTHGAYSYPSAMLDYMACCILEDSTFLDFYVHESRRRLHKNFLLVADFLSRYKIPFHGLTTVGMFVWVNLGAVYRPKEMYGATCETDTSLAFASPEVSDGWIVVGPNKSSASSTEDTIIQALAAHKVFLASGQAFGSEREGWFRIVVSQDSKILYEGLVRMVIALGLTGGRDMASCSKHRRLAR